MSVLGSIIGSAVDAANPANTPTNLVNAAKGIIGMFKLDPNVKAQLQEQLTEKQLDTDKAAMAQDLALAQMQADTNAKEAQSMSWFVAGWRPFVGWVCATALAYAVVLQPLMQFVLGAFHVTLAPGALPTLDTAEVIELLVPMLGIGAMRTYEKVTNTEGNR